jgi:hypothetical protein
MIADEMIWLGIISNSLQRVAVNSFGISLVLSFVPSGLGG